MRAVVCGSAVLMASLQAATAQPALEPLEARFQVRGYFYAGGRTAGMGGFAPSDNLPVVAEPALRGHGSIKIIVSDERSAFGKSLGRTILVVNDTGSEQGFDAQDSRLPMIHEALDKEGRWRPIEYLPQSFCGNSDHEVYLPAGSAWRFVAPVYGGTMATKLRVRLEHPTLGALYSEPFAGKIHPAQMNPKNRQGHQPNGIMDPYGE